MRYKMQASIHILEQYLQQITYVGLQMSRIPRNTGLVLNCRPFEPMQLTLLT